MKTFCKVAHMETNLPCDYSGCSFYGECQENYKHWFHDRQQEALNPYSKKYTLDNLVEFNEHNPVYDDLMCGCTCYLAYLKPGERGWFLWETDSKYEMPHRIHTSVIEHVEYLEGWVTVRTQNTSFVFAPVEED